MGCNTSQEQNNSNPGINTGNDDENHHQENESDNKSSSNDTTGSDNKKEMLENNENELKSSSDKNKVTNGDTNGEDFAMDLDGSKEEEDAAKKIQAVFRGHKARATMKQGEQSSNTNDNNTAALNADNSEPTKQELEAEFDPNDKELCNAAIRIQSTFRGHMARKINATEGGEIKPEELKDITKQVAEELDIDMNDPELHKAASKIQASFRGHKARRDEDVATGVAK